MGNPQIHPRPGVVVATALVLALASASVASAASPRTKRVSVSSGGAQTTLDSSDAAISASGRFVAFESEATNLVSADTNSGSDIFVRDRKKGKTRRVSVSSAGAQANVGSVAPAISADGRFVAFQSPAANLVPGDTNGATDIFIHDRKTHKTRRASVRSDGAQANLDSADAAISANGRFVAFASEATNLVAGGAKRGSHLRGSPIFTDVFVHDRKSGKTRRASRRADGGAVTGADASISANGRFVAFETFEPAVPGDTGGLDIFVRDRKRGKTKRASLTSAGAEPNSGSLDAAISANRRFVAFESLATNMVAGDTNGIRDIFVRDLKRRKTRRVNVSSTGAQANVESFNAAISADGRFVAFTSNATNLVPGDTNGATDIFVRDRKRGKTRRVNLSSAGGEASGFFSSNPAISANGRFVAFETTAANLVAGDTNNAQDVFVRGPLR